MRLTKQQLNARKRRRARSKRTRVTVKLWLRGVL